MGIITSGIISKVIDIAGNILDPSKKNQLEIALKEKEIELQMEKALDKIPFEIKKIKFALGVIKRIKKVKMIFKFK